MFTLLLADSASAPPPPDALSLDPKPIAPAKVEKAMPGVSLAPMPHPGWRTDTRTSLAPNGDVYVGGGGVMWHCTDRGRTWSMRELPSHLNAAGGMCVLRDGTFILVSGAPAGYGSTTRSDGVVLKDGSQNFVYRSTDSGKTWTEPVELDLAPFNRGGDGWTQGYQHPDGDVMITMTLRVVGADPEDITAGIHEHIYRSTDGGKTWSDRVLLHAHGAESSLLALRDSNKMLAIIRAQRFRFDSDTPELFKTFGTPPDGRIALKNGVLAESNDGGRTWGNPRLFTGFGDVPGELIQTPDGRIAALWLHRYPHPQGRVCVRISEDGGATWGDTQYVLFDGNGYSSSVVFDDGAIVTVCENTPLDAGGHPAGARSMVAALWRLPAR